MDAAVGQKLDQLFREPRNQYAQPIDRRLEYDGLDHGRPVKATHKRQVVSCQHRLSNQQRG
jgi:hypothetical protein